MYDELKYLNLKGRLLLRIARKINISCKHWYHYNGLHCLCNICNKNFDANFDAIEQHGSKHIKESNLLVFL